MYLDGKFYERLFLGFEGKLKRFGNKKIRYDSNLIDSYTEALKIHNAALRYQNKNLYIY